MTGWLIGLGVAVLICLLPVGVIAGYDAAGAAVAVRVGLLQFRLYPARKVKAKSTQNGPQDKSGGKPSREKKQKPEKKAESTAKSGESRGGSWTDFLPLVDVGLDFLGDVRRKLRVRLLKLHVTMAGDDPCDLAVNYGRLQAAAAGLLAQLDRLFVIRKQDVRMDCDFTGDETRVIAQLDVSITVGRVLSLAVGYGLRALKTFLKINKQRKGGAAI